MYDTVLNRDLTPTNYENLAKYVVNGLIDKIALANAILPPSNPPGSEFFIKYGDKVDAEVIAQAYFSALGRAPSLGELNQHLSDIAAGVAQGMASWSKFPRAPSISC